MKRLKRSIFYENRFVLASCGIAAGTMLIIYMCTQLFPLGNNTVLRMDLYHQYGPLFAELYDRIFSGSSLTYSWTSGLGSCFLGNYFNYLSSPIGAIVVFFGHKHVPEAIAAMILIKAALSAGTFTYYLKCSLKSHTPVSAAFGVLYAFCAYMLAYYWNVMWLDAMVLLPVILLGIERIINNGSIVTYTAALALSMFSNYYMSFMLCIFSVIYFIYYFISTYTFGSVVNKKYALRNHSFSSTIKNNRFLRSGVLFALGSLAAAGLMAFALIPTYRVLQNCSATSGSFPQDVKQYFTFFDFFANHLGALTTTIRSSGDDVLPNVYCGIMTLILAPLYFFTKSISRKEKLATTGILAVLYFSFNFNFLNYIWHGFHFPNDLPYRFSFMYSFILLVMAYKTFIRLKEFSSRQLGAVGAAIIAFIVIVEDIKSKNVTSTSVYFTIAFIVFYVLLLICMKDKKAPVYSIAVLLCVCICSEIIICDTQSFPNNVTRDSYESDYDDFREIKGQLDEIEENGFFRMELTDLRTRMDNSWFGYNGVSVFSSMAYEKLAKLESAMGMMSNKINSYTYNPQTPVYNMMHSLKYIVNNQTPDVLSKKYYSRIASVSKYDAYQNKYYLPLGFCVDSSVEYWDRELSNPFNVQEDFFARATGIDDELFRKIPIMFINYSNTDPFTESLDDNVFYFNKTDKSATDASATFTISVQKKGNVYIYFNVDGSNGKDVNISTDLGTITHSSSQECILDLGRYEEGQTIYVTIPFEKDNGYVTFYAYTMNDKVFEKGYNLLNSNVLNLTDFDETTLEGSFTAPEDCLLYMSVPYDKGWLVSVDGERVSKENIVAVGDALIGIRVGKGEHTLSMRYSVPGLLGGIMISVFALAVILILLLIRVLKKRLKKKKALPSFAKVKNAYSEEIFVKIQKPALNKDAVETVNLPPRSQAPVREIITPPQAEPEIITPPKQETQSENNKIL